MGETGKSGAPGDINDLFKIDVREFDSARPQAPRHSSESPVDDIFSGPAPTGGTTPPAGPDSETVPDLSTMSRGQIDAWVAGEIMSVGKASTASGAIRTETATGASDHRQRNILATSLLAVGAIGFAWMGWQAISKPEVVLPRGPFVIHPAAMVNGGPSSQMAGHTRKWQIETKSDDTMSATRHALILGRSDELAFIDPETGTTIRRIDASGKVDTTLSGDVVGKAGKSTSVAVIQQGNAATVIPLKGSDEPARVELPPDARLSARLDGILVKSDDGLDLMVDESGDDGFRVGLKRMKDPRPSKESDVDAWGYASTPEGDVWWLHHDGSATLPSGKVTRHVRAKQPHSGLKFAGWVGAGIGDAYDGSGTLIGAWNDPSNDQLYLVTHSPIDGRAIQGAPVRSADITGGAVGDVTRYLAIGKLLIDATSGRIAATTGATANKLDGTFGGVAAIVTGGGDRAVVDLTELDSKPKKVRVKPVKVKIIGSSDEETLIVQTPKDGVAGYS